MVTTIVKLFLALAIGIYLNKKKILTGEINRAISTMVMDIFLPFMIVTSVSNAQGADKGALVKYIIVGIAIYIALPFVGKLLVKILRIRAEDKVPFELFVVFANCLFMGYPVSAALYGDSSIFYISIFHLMFNIMYFTYATKRLRGDDKEKKEKHNIRALLSNGTIASLLALFMFFFDISLPEGVTTVMNFLGTLTTPLSMLVIGASIGTVELKRLMSDKQMYGMAIFRLIVIPVIIYFVMTALGFDGNLRGIAVITLGMPVASMVSMGSIQYNRYVEVTSAGVVFSTICSLITMPIMLMLLNHIG